MKKLTISIAALAFIFSSANAGKNVIPAPVEPIPVPTPVSAPLGLYLGGGYTYAKADCECNEIYLSSGKYTPKFNATTHGVNLKVGYDFNEFIGIEAKYLYTPWGDEYNTIKHYGLYLKPNYPVTENIDVYALIGYGKTECESMKDSENGLGWGVGASYNFGKRSMGKKEGLGVYVEYLRPLKKTGNKNITIDTVNAGLQYNF